MPKQELGKLEQVGVGSIWSHEEYDFTPWLVENIDLLSETLGIGLESPEREVLLRGAGRVDIRAIVRSDETEETATVVIENQLNVSDEDHFVRLLGYAAISDASILVWIASSFTNYYVKMIEWLNQWSGEGNKIYAVKVGALRIHESYAPEFEVVVGPKPVFTSQKRNVVATKATAYAEFYRPVAAQLRRAGLPPAGRGGYRGKWRSFETGHPPHFYSLGLEDVGEARVYFEARGDDAQTVYDALRKQRVEIDRKLSDATVEWHDGQRWVALKTRASLDDTEEQHEETREWMVSNLLKLRDVIQPQLDRIMAELQPTEMDDAALLQNDTEPSP